MDRDSRRVLTRTLEVSAGDPLSPLASQIDPHVILIHTSAPPTSRTSPTQTPDHRWPLYALTGHHCLCAVPSSRQPPRARTPRLESGTGERPRPRTNRGRGRGRGPGCPCPAATCAATSLANAAAKWRSTRFSPRGFNCYASALDDRDFVILAAISGSARSVMGFSIGPGLQEITD